MICFFWFFFFFWSSLIDKNTSKYLSMFGLAVKMFQGMTEFYPLVLSKWILLNSLVYMTLMIFLHKWKKN